MDMTRALRKQKNGNSQYYQDDSGCPVQGFRLRFICKPSGNSGPHKSEHYAQNPDKQVRDTAYYKVRDCARKSGKCHNKDTGTHGGFKFIPQNGGQD